VLSDLDIEGEKDIEHLDLVLGHVTDYLEGNATTNSNKNGTNNIDLNKNGTNNIMRLIKEITLEGDCRPKFSRG